MDTSHIFPYVVTKQTLEQLSPAERSLTQTLGRDTSVVLMHDLNGVAASVDPADATEMGITPGELHYMAVQNLERLVSKEAIVVEPHFTAAAPYLTWAGHWLAASCIRLPSLRGLCATVLGKGELVAAIPTSECMYVFQKGDAKTRAAMQLTIAELEASAPKRLTNALFEITPRGPEEL